MDGERPIRQLTTGMHVFSVLRCSDRAKYVDKTALLHELCGDVDQQLFISRPRRFGKSLMLSTLKEMFECRRELFKGLAIDSLPLAALLYQGGYLTISEVIDDTMLRLGIPNNEIANSLSEGYVSSMLGNALPDWNEQLAEVRADARTRF